MKTAKMNATDHLAYLASPYGLDLEIKERKIVSLIERTRLAAGHTPRSLAELEQIAAKRIAAARQMN